MLSLLVPILLSQDLSQEIYILGNVFKMGDDNLIKGLNVEFPVNASGIRRIEYIAHYVEVSSFFIGKYEVTVGEYKKFVNETSYKIFYQVYHGLDENFWERYEGKDDYQMGYLNYPDMIAYCQWLTNKTGDLYRLPTEAEWEYMARRNSNGRFPWGDTSKKFIIDIKSDKPDDYGRHNSPVSYFSSDITKDGVIGTFGGQETILDFSHTSFYSESPAINPVSVAGFPYARGQKRGYWAKENTNQGVLKRNSISYITKTPRDYYSFRVLRSSYDLIFNENTVTECTYFPKKGICLENNLSLHTKPDQNSSVRGYLFKNSYVDILFKSLSITGESEKSHNWYFIVYTKPFHKNGYTCFQSKTGWIKGSDLKLLEKFWYEEDYSYLLPIQ